MAPEQALGKTVDKRADIWSFGCVLFEMLSGRRAFAGKDISDTLSLVIGSDPDWTALPSNTPAPIVRILRQCLHKDRSRRLADIADARLAIEEALSPSTEFSDTAGGTVLALDRVVARAALHPRSGEWRRPGVRAVGGAPVANDARERSAAPDRGSGPRCRLTFGSGSSLALSPNGTELAFIGHKPTDGMPRLFVRNLEHQEDAGPSARDRRRREPVFFPPTANGSHSSRQGS